MESIQKQGMFTVKFSIREVMKMKRSLRLLMLLFFSLSIISVGSAQDNQIVSIKLLYPKRGITSIMSDRVSTRPEEAGGVIILTVDSKPTIEDVQNNRFLIEYYLDGELLYESNGENLNNPQSPSFDCQLDTTRYVNGKHQITVNLWDDDVPSAIIGIKNIIINNVRRDE